jgi:Ras-related protein Rab-21
VGKSSLTIKYCRNKFDDKQESTVDATFNQKEVVIDQKTKVGLTIWDTAGQERYHALNVSYYRESKGAVLVYDVTDQDSFKKVQKWQSELEKYLPGAPIMIAANKCDMVNKNVDEEMAIAYARSVGAELLPTSAKTGHNVNEIFT